MISAGIIAGIVIAVVIILILGKLYFNGGKCKLIRDLTGKVVIITGGNTGIGKIAAKVIAQMNATVILACRDAKKSEAAIEDIQKFSKNPKVYFMRLDLSDLSSVKEFADKFKVSYNQLDILINNAGMLATSTRATTPYNFECQLGVNHLGHFYLTSLLMDTIKASTPSRIINVSSMAHTMGKMHWNDLMLERGYGKWKAYSQSKLANILFTIELQKRFNAEGIDVKAVALHPGVVRTELWRNELTAWYGKVISFISSPGKWYFLKNPEQGAQTTIECALLEHDKLKGGCYYVDCKVHKTSKAAKNFDDSLQLWEESEKLVQINQYQAPVLGV